MHNLSGSKNANDRRPDPKTATGVDKSETHQILSKIPRSCVFSIVRPRVFRGDHPLSAHDGVHGRSRLDSVEVVDGEIVGTTVPRWLCLPIRELFAQANRRGWSVEK